MNWLHDEKGVTEVDFVRPPMGGLYSWRPSGCWATTDSKVKIRSLTTIGTPWQGSISDYANDPMALSECQGDKFCESAVTQFKERVLELMAGSGREVNKKFLMGRTGGTHSRPGCSTESRWH